MLRKNPYNSFYLKGKKAYLFLFASEIMKRKEKFSKNQHCSKYFTSSINNLSYTTKIYQGPYLKNIVTTK